jgi:quercetin dioxygenase-like cupin family protein
MSIAFTLSRGTEAPIAIPAIGLELHVRVPPVASGGEFCFIETTNAPGAGPPRHRHPQAEIFRVIEGRYLYEVDGRRFFADAGDVVAIPGNAVHGFVNVGNRPARQYILIAPALDATAFFTELAGVMQDGVPDRQALNAFGIKWQVEFMGPPVSPAEQPGV